MKILMKTMDDEWLMIGEELKILAKIPLKRSSTFSTISNTFLHSRTFEFFNTFSKLSGRNCCWVSSWEVSDQKNQFEKFERK